MATTPILGLTTPDAGDAPNVPADMSALAQEIETKLVMPFADATERDAQVTAPSAGMMCELADTGELQIYESSAWRTFFTGKAPGSAVGRGHIVSYQTTAPTDVQAGAVAIDRDTGQAYMRSNAGTYVPLGAAAVMAFGNTAITAPGTVTAEGSSSTCVSYSITTTVANTDLHLFGNAMYALYGVAVFGNQWGGWQNVAVTLNVTPPGGSLTELTRRTNAEMNTGGTGSTTVGGPTLRNATAQWVYRCVTVGTYTFSVRIVCGSAGQGPVNNLGGDLTIKPIVRVTTF